MQKLAWAPAQWLVLPSERLYSIPRFKISWLRSFTDTQNGQIDPRSQETNGLVHIQATEFTQDLQSAMNVDTYTYEVTVLHCHGPTLSPIRDPSTTCAITFLCCELSFSHGDGQSTSHSIGLTLSKMASTLDLILHVPLQYDTAFFPRGESSSHSLESGLALWLVLSMA
jgi:hypothetical protein